MKRRSMIATGILLLCLVNLVWDFVDYTTQVREFRRQTYEKIALDVAEQFELFTQRPPGQDMREYLQSLQEREKIAFFIIKGSREPASSSLPDRVNPDFQAVSDGQVRLILDGESREPQAAYVAEKIDEREVVIGKFMPQNYMAETIALNRAFFWRSFFVQLVIFGAVVLYSFRELRNLVNILQWGGGRPQFSFSETNSIASAIQRVTTRQKEDSDELESVRSQVVPSLLTELQASDEPPYEFEAVMVRIDINDSTKVYSTPALRKVQDHWFDYFKILSAETAGRYNGVLHEENGDEVIFYFKAMPSLEVASLAAIACLRDIFALAEECDRAIRSEFDFRFNVKAAVDIGRLRVFKPAFVALGFGERRVKIEGASGDGRNPFLTTVRMLKFVEDKSTNGAILSGRVMEHARALVTGEVSLQKRIPGIEDTELYHLVRQFVDLDQCGSSYTVYFRSDRTLAARLKTAIAGVDVDEAARLKALLPLSTLRLAHVSRELQAAYLELLAASLTAPVAPATTSARVLATLIALAPKFVRDADLQEELSANLAKGLSHADDRVQANSIEVWGELNLQLTEIRTKMSAFKHNRSRANALEVGLKAGLDRRLLKELGRMLGSQEWLDQAAGCYAVGEIIEHYRRVDPLLLGANPQLNHFVEKTRSLVGHDDPMIRRQAERAMAKIAA